MQVTLPPQATPFVGRSEDLASVEHLLADPACRLLTIVGPGGIGKTRLALEVAARTAPRFAHSMAFIPLQAVSAPANFVPFLASTLHITFYGSESPYHQLLNNLRDQQMLIVLDNFEHLLPAVGLISDIVAQASRVKLLVTSREVLNVMEEWLFPLQGMTAPPSVYSDEVETYDSVRLFVENARRVNRTFSLEAERKSVVNICRLTGGMPLALEMAAAALKVWSCHQIVHELQTNFDFLARSARNTPERHRTMRAVFDSSWRLLTDEEHQVFARLSVFQGSFELHAAEMVADAKTPIMISLIDKSFLQQEASARYRVHELLRQYGAEKLRVASATDVCRQHHAAYYAGQTADAHDGLMSADSVRAMQAIEVDFENIRQAWEWSVEKGSEALLDRMLHTLYLFGFMRSRHHEISALFESALSRGGYGDLLTARLLTRRWGYLHWWYLDDYNAAFDDLRRALALLESSGEAFEIGLTQLMLGYVYLSTQQYEQALDLLMESKAVFESIGADYYVCWVLHRIGYARSNMYGLDPDDRYTKQSLVLARATFNRVAQVICLYNLAEELLVSQNYAKAAVYNQEALQVATESGHKGQIAYSLASLALCAFCRGDYGQAKTDAEQSLELTRETYLFTFQAYPVAVLIVLASMNGDLTEASRLEAVGEAYGTNTMGQFLLNWSLAVLECCLHDAARVREHVRNAVERGAATACPVYRCWLAPCVAYACAGSAPQRATELLAWSKSHDDSALDWIDHLDLFDQLAADLRSCLGEEAFEQGWTRGAALTHNEVDALFSAEIAATTASDVVQDLLTPREIEVLRLMAAGLTNPQIAAQLVIGSGTVKTHTLNIYRKLDVMNRTQAVERARALQLLNL